MPRIGMSSDSAQPNLRTWRDPNLGVLLEVADWTTLTSVDDQYVVRPRSPALVWRYWRRLGIIAVARKVWSRLAETRRNRKVVASGSGHVLEAPEGSKLRAGELVAFLATNHSLPCGNQIIVDHRFVRLFASVGRPENMDDAQRRATLPPSLHPYVGWSSYSGVPVEPADVDTAFSEILSNRVGRGAAGGASEPLKACAIRFDRMPARRESRGRPTAVLFGLGNYAKTLVVPSVRRDLDLMCVHEVDPDQLQPAHKWGVGLDTAPVPRPDEAYDAWYIAGYHHTHAPLAIHALSLGAYAIVEKPLATTWEQFHALEAAVDACETNRLFSCFQRRHTLMNDWAREDLGAAEGAAINYHCIVYEMPLPERHWYRWPTSGSRLVANGCHWIDHFLYLNGYPGVTRHVVLQAQQGDLMVLLETDNDAAFSMAMTDMGSDRLGVRDYVELRQGRSTVQMVDQQYYRAEDDVRVLRRGRLNPIDSYYRMYAASVRTVKDRVSTEDPRSLASMRATLTLEDQLRAGGRQKHGEGMGRHPGMDWTPQEVVP